MNVTFFITHVRNWSYASADLLACRYEGKRDHFTIEIGIYFTLFVFLISCDCYYTEALPHGTVGWFAVSDCGIF